MLPYLNSLSPRTLPGLYKRNIENKFTHALLYSCQVWMCPTCGAEPTEPWHLGNPNAVPVWGIAYEYAKKNQNKINYWLWPMSSCEQHCGYWETCVQSILKVCNSIFLNIRQNKWMSKHSMFWTPSLMWLLRWRVKASVFVIPSRSKWNESEQTLTFPLALTGPHSLDSHSASQR